MKIRKVVSIVLVLALVLGVSASASFGAAKKIKKIKITSPSAKTYTLNVGAKAKFKIKLSPKGATKSVTWKSSSKKIATVSKKGVVTGKSVGTVKITVASKKSKKIKATKTVKVVSPVKTATIAGKAVVGNVLTATVTPAKATAKYAWYRVEGGNRVAIAGATGKTYTPTPSDAGKAIQVGISGTKYYTGTKYSGAVTISSAEDAFKKAINQQYGLGVIQTLISRKSNSELGFRMSGSAAEKANADYIYNEYKKMGLKNVTMDNIKADGFEYKKGKLTFSDGQGSRTVSLGSYQTTFATGGPKQYGLVYAGKGYKSDYDALRAAGVDVEGKIVLVDTDQYNEYWINFPAYEAKVQGAAALISCEDSDEDAAYARLSDDQIQQNDICGPADAPALSVSRNTRDALKAQIAASADGFINVTLDVDAVVTPNKGSQNVWAEIPGKSSETIILMAHYDSYWNAALDDADGTGVLMTLAKALSEGGYVPEKTIRFVHHGAEEWGMSGSIYDWAIGAFRQIKEVHPEWADSAFVALNVDSFTVENRGASAANGAMYKKVRINAPQLDQFARSVIDKNLPAGYTIGRYDTVANNFFEDFSYLTSGIPKMLFTRSDYQSQYDTYHSSADNYDYYSRVAKQDVIMGDKVQIVGAALMAFDQQLVQPLNYASYFGALGESIDTALGGAAATRTKNAVQEASAAAIRLDAAVSQLNADYASALKAGNTAEAARLKQKAAAAGKEMSALYKQFQKRFTRLDHAGSVVAPHEAYQSNLGALQNAADALEDADIGDAIDELSAVDSNGLALHFSRATYSQAVAQKTGTIGADKMAWGANMIDEDNQNLYRVVSNLMAKESQTSPALDYEEEAVADAIDDQQGYLGKMLAKESGDCQAMKSSMDSILAKIK